jgi:putative membrane protein
MRSHIIMAALLVAPGAALLAQDTSTTQMPQRDTIRGYNSPQSSMGRRDTLRGDHALIVKIHKINQMEIELGQLAQRNSATAKVKSYGQQLVRDHQAADQKISTLAQSLGVTFPAEGKRGNMGRDTTQRADKGYTRDEYPRDTTQRGQMHGHDHEATQEHAQLQRLSTLRGAQFDAEFANFMAQGHDKAIKMLEQAQRTVQSAELRTFITSTLPTLRTHLQVAQSLGGSTSANTTTSSQ